MSAVGDVFVLRVRMTHMGEDCYNVFHYRVVASSGLNGAPHLLSAFDGGVLASLMGIMSTQLAVQEMEAINWGNPSESASILGAAMTNDVGLVAGDYLPPNWVYNFHYFRRQPGQHAGSKRFSGVPEARVTNGNIDLAFAAAFTAAANALKATINFGTTSFIPYIAARRRNGVDVYPPIGTPISVGYDVPDVALPNLSSQRTRKL